MHCTGIESVKKLERGRRNAVDKIRCAGKSEEFVVKAVQAAATTIDEVERKALSLNLLCLHGNAINIVH